MSPAQVKWAVGGDAAYSGFMHSLGGRLIADTRVAAELVQGGLSRSQARDVLALYDIQLVRRWSYRTATEIAGQLGRTLAGTHRSDMLIMSTARETGATLISNDVSMIAGAARAGLDARLVGFGANSGGVATSLVGKLIPWGLNRTDFFFWFNPL